MSLFAKGHKFNPMTEEEKAEVAARDTRPVWEIWADQKKAHGIDTMSDEELDAVNKATPVGHELKQAISHEVRGRQNARDTRTDAQKYIDAPESIWH